MIRQPHDHPKHTNFNSLTLFSKVSTLTKVLIILIEPKYINVDHLHTNGVECCFAKRTRGQGLFCTNMSSIYPSI